MESTSVNHRLDLRLQSLGFLVAFLSAGIGIGGGTLLVSVLHSALKLDFKKSAIISLAAIIPISFIGSISHFVLHPGALPIKYYLVFIPACITGSLFGGAMLRSGQNGWRPLAFGVFLLLVSLRMLQLFDFTSLIHGGMDAAFYQQCLIIIPIGMLFGIIAVSLGVGCGLLIVPFFVMVIGFNIYRAITLSLTTMFFVTLLTTLIINRTALKAMNARLAKRLLLPALGGAILGVTFSRYLPAEVIKYFIGAFLLFMAFFIIAVKIVSHRRPMSWLGNSNEASIRDSAA